jgi:hypothetical protein
MLGRYMGCYIMGDFEKIMAEAADKIRREAYAAGWRDCAATIAKLAADSRPSELADIPVDDRQEEEFSGRIPPGANLPTVGTTPHYVYGAVRKKPGMTGAEVIAAVHADGHTVAEAGIRTALARLDKRKLIVNRHKRWFPT